MKSLRNALPSSALLVILLAAALGAVLAFVGLQLIGDDEPTATASVGLTTASVWPSYQSDLDSFANVVTRDDVIAQVEDSIGGDILSVTTDGVEGTFVLDVIATAESQEIAAAAVEALVDVGIQTQAAQATGPTDQELELLMTKQSELQTEIDEFMVAEATARAEAIRLAGLVDAGDFSFESEALYREADAVAGRATQDRNAAEQRLRSLANQVDDLDLRTSLPSDRLYVVQDSRVEDAAASIKGPVPVLAAALAAALAAGSWLIARDRLNGPVQSAEQVERVLGIPVVAHLSGGDDTYEGVRLRQALASVGKKGRLELVIDESVEMGFDYVHDALVKAVGSGGDNPSDWVSTNGNRGDGVLLAIRSGASSVDSVRRQAQLLQAGKMPLAGVVLT